MKKKLPKWFWFVHDCIPVFIPLLYLFFVCLDIIGGWSGKDWYAGASAAVDLIEQLQGLSSEVQVPLMISLWLTVVILVEVCRLLWFLGGICISKLKEFLHSKKTPR